MPRKGKALGIFNPPLHLVNIVSRAAAAFNYPQFRNFPAEKEKERESDADRGEFAECERREKKLKSRRRQSDVESRNRQLSERGCLLKDFLREVLKPG